MTSLKLKIFLVISVALILPRSVYSHDGWVEISPSIVEKNQSATIALIQGNHSTSIRATASPANGIKSIRRWSLSIRKLNKIL